MKKLLILALLVVLLGGTTQVYAKNGLSLHDAYTQIEDYIIEKEINYSIDYKQYKAHYDEYGYQFENINEYNLVLMQKLDFFDTQLSIQENEVVDDFAISVQSSISSGSSNDD